MATQSLPYAPVDAARAGRELAVVIFANLGFYHLARLRALAQTWPIKAIELAAQQKLYGWEVDKTGYDVVTLHKGAFEERRNFWGRLKLTWLLLRELNAIKPAALLIPGYSDLCSIGAAVWGKLHQARTVMMFESTEIDRRRVWYRELVKRILVKCLFDFGFVGGQRTSDYLAKLGMPTHRIVRAYDVVDNTFFARGADHLRSTSSHDEWGLPKDYFLYVGRLAPEKNLELLLKSFHKYVERGGRWPLVLVGKGPLETQLRSTSGRLGLNGRVHFAGFKNGSELFPYYAFASCFILPSVREPWGLVVNEAMAAGLPVVVSERCGCAPELVHDGVNGYKIDPQDEESLAQRLLSTSLLPLESIAAMGHASRKIVAGLGPEQWAASITQVLLRQN